MGTLKTWDYIPSVHPSCFYCGEIYFKSLCTDYAMLPYPIIFFTMRKNYLPFWGSHCDLVGILRTWNFISSKVSLAASIVTKYGLPGEGYHMYQRFLGFKRKMESTQSGQILQQCLDLVQPFDKLRTNCTGTYKYFYCKVVLYLYCRLQPSFCSFKQEVLYPPRQPDSQIPLKRSP